MGGGGGGVYALQYYLPGCRPPLLAAVAVFACSPLGGGLVAGDLLAHADLASCRPRPGCRSAPLREDDYAMLCLSCPSKFSVEGLIFTQFFIINY